MTIVYAYIVGDIIHIGHLLHLENGKALGDTLVVGVLTDEAVMEKKPRPAIPFHERLDIVKSLTMVDIAVAQETYSPVNNILDIEPDVVVESNSHSYDILQSTKKASKSIGARVVVMPYSPTTSSTDIKKRIQSGN